MAAHIKPRDRSGEKRKHRIFHSKDIEQFEQREFLCNLLLNLDNRYGLIVARRACGETYRSIGVDFGVCPARIQQIEFSALRLLRRAMGMAGFELRDFLE